jgi:hypothetical protein
MPTIDSRLGFRLGQEHGYHTIRRANKAACQQSAQGSTKPPYHPVQEKVHHKATERCVMAYDPHIDTAKGAAPRHCVGRVSTHPRTASQAAPIHNDAVMCCHATRRISWRRELPICRHIIPTHAHTLYNTGSLTMYAQRQVKAEPSSKEPRPHTPLVCSCKQALPIRRPRTGPHSVHWKQPQDTTQDKAFVQHSTNLQAVSRTHSGPTSLPLPLQAPYQTISDTGDFVNPKHQGSKQSSPPPEPPHSDGVTSSRQTQIPLTIATRRTTHTGL